jgi:hypothetical protein
MPSRRVSRKRSRKHSRVNRKNSRKQSRKHSRVNHKNSRKSSHRKLFGTNFSVRNQVLRSSLLKNRGGEWVARKIDKAEDYLAQRPRLRKGLKIGGSILGAGVLAGVGYKVYSSRNNLEASINTLKNILVKNNSTESNYGQLFYDTISKITKDTLIDYIYDEFVYYYTNEYNSLINVLNTIIDISVRKQVLQIIIDIYEQTKHVQETRLKDDIENVNNLHNAMYKYINDNITKDKIKEVTYDREQNKAVEMTK